MNINRTFNYCFNSKKRHLKKSEDFALVKDSLEEAIIMESFQKSLALLQASNSKKCNIISNRKCLSIPKNSSISISIKNDFEDFKSNFIETLKRTNRTLYEPAKRIIF